MQEMKIAFYGKEADLFEAMLNEPVGVHPIEYTREPLKKTYEGYKFTIKCEKGNQFYFIGEAWTRKMMAYHCEHYSFSLADDDNFDLEAEENMDDDDLQ